MSACAIGAASLSGARRLATVFASVQPDSVSGVKGQLATLTLRADMGATGKSLGSYTVTLTWDSTVVRLDSVRGGDFAAPTVNFVSGAQVRLTQASATGLPGAFSLARLFFRFVNDTAGKRTVIQPSFTDFNATDFTQMLPELATSAGVARVLAPPVAVRATPDSLRERVAYKPLIELTADLSQASGVALGSYAASVTWDSTVMRLDSVKAGDYVAPVTNQPTGAEVRLAASDAQGRGGAAFSLAKLYFSFLGDAFPRETPVTVAVSEMHAALSFANLLPGVTTKGGKALIGGVLRGDIDNSGSVAALDAQVILQAVVGLTLPSGARAVPNGDADCSGSLQAKDAQIVLNQVVGNDVAQFCVGKIQ